MPPRSCRKIDTICNMSTLLVSSSCLIPMSQQMNTPVLPIPALQKAKHKSVLLTNYIPKLLSHAACQYLPPMLIDSIPAMH